MLTSLHNKAAGALALSTTAPACLLGGGRDCAARRSLLRWELAESRPWLAGGGPRMCPDMVSPWSTRWGQGAR